MSTPNLPNTTILMCRPEYFTVSYEINPWMSKNSVPSRELALKQWESLKDTIISLGAKVELIAAVPALPDMVFTANAGLKWQDKVVVSHFRHPERQGEEKYYLEWFKKNGLKCLHSEKTIFEGAGDALSLGDTLFCGYGIRSEKAAYPEILNFLGIKEKDTVFCELIDPNFYHLDICFCPLTNSKALVYPDAFTEETWKRIDQSCEALIIPKEDAMRFAGNSVVIENSVIIPSGCKKTEDLLKSNGFDVYTVELSELLKGGGAAKCMTLQLGEINPASSNFDKI